MVPRLILVTIVSAFTLVLSIWGIDDRIATKFPELKPALDWLPTIAAIFVGLILVLTFFETVRLIFEAVGRVWEPPLRDMKCSDCKAEDLQKIHSIAQSQIGRVSSLTDTRKLYYHNRRAFQKIVNSKTNEVVGYFCVLPLTAKGEGVVKNRDPLLGDLEFDNFAKRFVKGRPVYIGGIAGTSKPAQGAALHFLRQFIVNREASRAYTRPMTSAGLRLVRHYSFKPVSDHDEVEIGTYVVRVSSFG